MWGAGAVGVQHKQRVQSEDKPHVRESHKVFIFEVFSVSGLHSLCLHSNIYIFMYFYLCTR